MIRKQPLTIDEFKSIYSKVPRLCVDLLIKNNNGVLLILRKKDGWVNQWHFPGGAVLFREKIKDAIHRIALEELGVKVTIDKFIGYIEFFDEVKERGFGYSISMVFLCNLAKVNSKIKDNTENIQFHTNIPSKMIAAQKEFLYKYNRSLE